MYIDLIVLIVLIAIIIIFFKNFSSVVYFIAIVDILLRILTAVKNNIPLQDIRAVINNYIPESIPSIVHKYLTGIPYTIFIWIYIIIFSIFLSYIIKTFWKKKR